MTTSEIHTLPFLESFFVLLDKSVLLHRRYFMSKFSEILILVCRKMFSCYPIFMKLLPVAMISLLCKNLILFVFLLMQEFNPFYPYLVLKVRKYFCSVLTDLSNLSFLFHQKWSEECFYKTVSKNADAAIHKCSSK